MITAHVARLDERLGRGRLQAVPRAGVTRWGQVLHRNTWSTDEESPNVRRDAALFSATSARSLGLPLCCSARPDPIPLTPGDGGPPNESAGNPFAAIRGCFQS